MKLKDYLHKKKVRIQTRIRILRSMDMLMKFPLLFDYYHSDFYKNNSWTLDQCRVYGRDFEELFFNKDFPDKLRNLTKDLSDEDQHQLKLIILRMIYLSFSSRKSLFSDNEKNALEESFHDKSKIKKCGEFYEYEGFKTKESMTHSFKDNLGLDFIPDSIIKRDKCIIDVGAYIGDTAYVLSKYTDNIVYAFEPFPEVHEKLKENIRINDLGKKILPQLLGLGDKTETKKLYFSAGNLGISTNDPDNALSKGAYTQSITINSTTLDSFVDENGISVGLIKIDAEGAEPQVLEGAKETIMRDKPVVLLSIYHNASDFFNLKPWIDDLEVGYKFKYIKMEASTIVEETMLVCYCEN